MIYLEVNGVPLEGFTNVRVSRSYQHVPALFSFSATVSPQDLTRFPVTVGDRCRVLVKDTVYCDGFVDEVNPRHNDNNHEISVRGASKVVDLVESCMDGTYDVKGPTTLKAALEGIIAKSGCDIKVINDTGKPYDFAEGELVAGQIGGGLWDLMLRCAMKKNVLLSETASGDIRITTGAGTRINTTLIKKLFGDTNNIMGSDMRLSHSDRYHTYQVVSQEDSNSLAFLDDAPSDEGGVDNVGTAFDVEIRNSRRKAFIAETSSTRDQCVERAVWQSNYQRVQSFEYNCTLQGFFYETGELIEPGQIVNVQDVYMSLSSDLIIDTVTFTYTEQGGSKSRINMLLPDAFTLEAAEPKVEQTGNAIGLDFLDE